jgi:hypothetical protein
MRYRARRVGGENLVEPVDRFAEFEGVKQRHRAVESRSRCLLARRLEAYRAQPFCLDGPGMMFVLGACDTRRREHGCHHSHG